MACVVVVTALTALSTASPSEAAAPSSAASGAVAGTSTAASAGAGTVTTASPAAAQRKKHRRKKHKRKHRHHHARPKPKPKKKAPLPTVSIIGTKARPVEHRDGDLVVRLAEFNVLGSQHTAPGGDAPGYLPGTTRAVGTAATLIANGAGVAGFGEAQRDQLVTLQQYMPTYGFYPGTDLGYPGIPTNIAYDTTKYQLITGGTIPITFVGQTRLMPYVELQDLSNGREFWVFNAHNSPRRGSNAFATERVAQVAAEIAQIKALQATGLPVFFMGDLNDTSALYCAVAQQTGMFSPAGGVADLTSCTPPPTNSIDWIFSTSNLFEDYLIDTSTKVNRLSDHAMTVVTARVR